MRSCKRASQLISESLDRRLGARERFALTVHMIVCAMCRAYRRQLLFIRSATRDLGRDDAAPDAGQRLSESARERLRKRLDQRP